MLTKRITQKALQEPPCYKCPDRDPGCHGKCEMYADWRAEHQRLNTEKWLDKKDPARSFLISNQSKRHDKWRKNHNDPL